MADKTVVVLGGGVGGMVAARELRRRLRNGHRVILVDKSPTHYFAPSYLWVALGWRRPQQISRELRSLLGQGVEYVQGQVEHIDLARGRVKASAREIPYDYLVVALGAELAYDGASGLFPRAYSFYDLEQALKLQEALPAFQGGSVVCVIPSLPYKCPAAPYEGALLLDYYFRRRGIRSKVEMRFFTPEPQPLPSAGPAVGPHAIDLLNQRGIAYHPRHRFKAVDPGKRELSFEEGTTAGYDLLIAIPPHRCPRPVVESGLAGPQGWVPVDKWTNKTPVAENVYALGDVTVIPLASGLPLPKAGVFAHGQAKVVARNIAAEILGGEKVAFDGKGG